MSQKAHTLPLKNIIFTDKSRTIYIEVRIYISHEVEWYSEVHDLT